MFKQTVFLKLKAKSFPAFHRAAEIALDHKRFGLSLMLRVCEEFVKTWQIK